MIKPEEYMSSPVITVGRDATAEEISKLMDTHNIGSVIVVDDDKLAGIVTERDLIRKVVAKNKKTAEMLAKDIMTEDVHAVSPDATLMEVSALMKKHTMRRIVVAEGKKPVGIITSRDIISLLVE